MLAIRLAAAPVNSFACTAGSYPGAESEPAAPVIPRPDRGSRQVSAAHLARASAADGQPQDAAGGRAWPAAGQAIAAGKPLLQYDPRTGPT